MSGVTYKHIGRVGKRQIYAVQLESGDLDSSFDSTRPAKESDELNASRLDARRQALARDRNPRYKSTPIREQTSGNVQF
jgi:hypothetical protein